jgi:hypothetical protein
MAHAEDGGKDEGGRMKDERAREIARVPQAHAEDGGKEEGGRMSERARSGGRRMARAEDIGKDEGGRMKDEGAREIGRVPHGARGGRGQG